MTVVITGDRITTIAPSRTVRISKGQQVVDGSGKFLVPGLWDMHVHIDLVGEAGLPLFIANGVTGVRDMGGGDFLTIKRWRERIEAGSLVGPHIKSPGPILESTRFVQMLERITGESMTGRRIGIATADEAAKAVDAVAALGVDFLKIRTNASRESYLAIAAEAKRLGLPLVGHAPSGISLAEASDAGQKSFEHGLVFLNNYTESEWKEIAARFLKNGTHSVPTLIAGRGFREMPDDQVMAIIDDTANKLDVRRKYVPAPLIEFWRKQMSMKKFESPTDWALVRQNAMRGFRFLKEAGVRMMSGTDLGAPLVFPGFSLHDELALLVDDLYMTPMETLQSATRIPAEFLGLGGSFGTIEKGKIADLVLLDANPLADIRNSRRIEAVIVGGNLNSRSHLQAMLSGVEASVSKH
jgi:imidazolonepropionase-like amidohydrolase